MEFRILGPLEVLDGGKPLSIRGAKERAVLVFLLLHAGQVVPADRLIDELWGEEPPETARQSLRVRIAGLRKALGGDSILTRTSGYVLHVERDALDLDHFQRLMTASEAAEPLAAAEQLTEALALWRGTPLWDFRYQSWAAGPIARLEELRLLAVERRIEAELALGRHPEVVVELQALVREHPLREPLRAQLMLALYRAGRQAEALDVYQSTRRTLVEQLGIEPGRALRELEQSILRQDPSLERGEPAAPERSILVVALGENNLDGLLALAAPLASRPQRELVLVQPIADGTNLPAASAELERRRQLLLADGIATRAAAFTSTAAAQDAVRVAAEQDVDLLLVDGPPGLLEDPVLAAMLSSAPCDVGVFVGAELEAGAVLVPFVGVEHDWSAVEVGAWLALAQQRPLRLAGPGEGPRDASRLLADASLVVQRAFGVAAEPLIVEPGAEELVRAADEAALVVAGLSDRWRKEGLGAVRSALIADARPPVLLVRRGLRPGGLAPPESHTRFTWTIRPT